MEATTCAIDGTVSCASLEEALALFWGSAGALATAATGAGAGAATGALTAAATGAGVAFLVAATDAEEACACWAGTDLAGVVLVLVTVVFEAGAAVGLAGFAAEAAAGLFEEFEDLDDAPAAFLEAAGAATLLAAWGLAAFGAVVAPARR